ncbi:hypothetical protein HOA92_07115 [archaeon]|jgi:hypothetical protein|nr:hypothetical protein [archaeon]MBT6762782.1 hypothetical protein [archaeon]
MKRYLSREEKATEFDSSEPRFIDQTRTQHNANPGNGIDLSNYEISDLLGSSHIGASNPTLELANLSTHADNAILMQRLLNDFGNYKGDLSAEQVLDSMVAHRITRDGDMFKLGASTYSPIGLADILSEQFDRRVSDKVPSNLANHVNQVFQAITSPTDLPTADGPMTAGKVYHELKKVGVSLNEEGEWHLHRDINVLKSDDPSDLACYRAIKVDDKLFAGKLSTRVVSDLAKLLITPSPSGGSRVEFLGEQVYGINPSPVVAEELPAKLGFFSQARADFGSGFRLARAYVGESVANSRLAYLAPSSIVEGYGLLIDRASKRVANSRLANFSPKKLADAFGNRIIESTEDLSGKKVAAALVGVCALSFGLEYARTHDLGAELSGAVATAGDGVVDVVSFLGTEAISGASYVFGEATELYGKGVELYDTQFGDEDTTPVVMTPIEIPEPAANYEPAVVTIEPVDLSPDYGANFIAATTVADVKSNIDSFVINEGYSTIRDNGVRTNRADQGFTHCIKNPHENAEGLLNMMTITGTGLNGNQWSSTLNRMEGVTYVGAAPIGGESYWGGDQVCVTKLE